MTKQWNNEGMDNLSKKIRYIEIDLLRTLAVVMMILYHTVYDLSAFYSVSINPFAGGWWILARVTAILFLLLVGISFVISWSRTKRRNFLERYLKYLRRGLIVFGFGLIVTIVTFIIDRETFVRFGILHLIGVSLILLPLFAWMKEGTLVLALLLLFLGHWTSGLVSETSLLLPFGIIPVNFATIDYFPLFPWLGVILIGMSLGHFFYIRHRQWRDKLLNVKSQLLIVTWPGRHALLLYLIHQPLILLILTILLGKPF